MIEADRNERADAALGIDRSAYEILLPDRGTVPLIFNSPHSGTYYPDTFLASSRLDRQSIRRSEDMFVDRLFASAVERGAPLMRAVYPRAFLDVNREPYELDPKMFAEPLPTFANSRSLRVAGGLGTVPRIVADAEEIYGSPLPVAEALARIEGIYRPYHDALRHLLAKTHVAFGFAVLIDCHSMPSSVRGAETRVRPDFVLGDRYGTSCAAEVTSTAVTTLRDLGYSVSCNKPYAGGFITEHYGRPVRGLHAVQIEVNRALYMNEKTLQPHAGMARLQGDLSRLADSLAFLAEDLSSPLREAAE